MTIREKIAMLTPEQQKSMLRKIRESGEQYRVYPLSIQQQRMWYLFNLYPDSTNYISRFIFRIRGSARQQDLDRAFAAVVERFKVLRTVFFNVDGVPFQTYLDGVEVISEVLAWCEHGGEADLERRTRTVFDLTCELPWRCWYVQKSASEHFYILSLHHVTHDGWAIGLLLNLFKQVYEAIVCRGTCPPAARYDYMDYALRQSRTPKSGAEAARRFWTDYLAGCKRGIPFRKLTAAEQEADQISILMDAADIPAAALAEQAGKQRTTLYNLFLTAFLYTLQRALPGHRAFNVGMPVFNRSDAEDLKVFGYYADTTLIHMPAGQCQMDGLAAYVDAQMKRILASGNSSFDEIVRWVEAPREMDEPVLFNIMFSMQSQQLMGQASGTAFRCGAAEMTFEAFHGEQNTYTEYALTLTVLEAADGLKAGFSYAKTYFRKKEMEAFRQDFLAVLTTLAETGAVRRPSEPSVTFALTELPDPGHRPQEAAGTLHQPVHPAVRADVAAIWRDILQGADIRDETPFFSAGGTSINIFQVQKRLNDCFGLNLTMVDLFKYNTVAALSRFIQNQLPDQAGYWTAHPAAPCAADQGSLSGLMF